MFLLTMSLNSFVESLHINPNHIQKFILTHPTKFQLNSTKLTTDKLKTIQHNDEDQDKTKPVSAKNVPICGWSEAKLSLFV